MSRDSRNSLSEGLQWASRITTLAIGFVLPAILGHYLDGWLGSSPVGVLVGVVFGFAAGIMQLLRIARGDPGR